MKPKILLSVNLKKEYYIDAVNSCGGIAYAEYCPEVSDDFDGLLLCGGNDINPEMYGEGMNGSVNLDIKRDEAECKLFEAFMAAGKPIMGICRGHQMINVMLGGNLYQNLENACMHANMTDFYCTHDVRAEKGSLIEKLYGESFSINSSHHQAVKKLGQGLKATLFSDGVIEGFEHDTLPILGVQFHPERMCCSQKRDDTVDGLKIIEYFINMCKK